MRGCTLPSGNAAEFPKLDDELRRRGINPLVRLHEHGGRTYLFTDEQITRLPTDAKGPYFGDDVSGHSIYEIDDQLAIYHPLFVVARRPSSIADRVTRFPFGDGSTMIIRGMFGKDECFTNERAGSFNVTCARQWADANLPISGVIIDVEATLLHLHKDIDLDEELLMQIAERSFDDVLRDTVLLYVMMPDGTQMLIDGNHRLAFLTMCCSRRGERELRANARLLTYEAAQFFKVSYVEVSADGRERSITADELLTRISGIYSDPSGKVREDFQRKRGSQS